MDRNEFKSLPDTFFDEKTSRSEPRWLLALGIACVVASVVIAAALLLRS
jgi:hypothetical protein